MWVLRPSRASRPTWHRVENREWCTDRIRMGKIHNEVQEENLAQHLASGGLADGAWAHGIPRRTASAWPAPGGAIVATGTTGPGPSPKLR